jgi:hypothetical protein
MKGILQFSMQTCRFKVLKILQKLVFTFSASCNQLLYMGSYLKTGF